MSYRLRDRAARIRPNLDESTLARVLEIAEDLKRQRVYPSLFHLQRQLRGELPYAVTYTAREVLLETKRLQLPSPNECRHNVLSSETVRKRKKERADAATLPSDAIRGGPCWRAIREYRQATRWWRKPKREG